MNRRQQASLQAVFALDRVGGGLHFLSVCFVFVTGSSRIQRPQRGKPHQHHDRQADRRPQRAGEHRGRDLCPPPVDVTAGVPGMDFFFPLRSLFERTVPALSVVTLKERSPWRTRGFTERHLE